MRKRYLPFGYQIKQGEIAIVSKESNAVRFIFEEYLAGKSLKGIADIMSAKDIPYHEGHPKMESKHGGTNPCKQNLLRQCKISADYFRNSIQFG